MPGPAPKEYEPSQRDQEIYTLRQTTSLTLRQIGDRYELSPAGISKICDKVQDFCKNYFLDDVYHVKTDASVVQRKIMQEALGEWERSKTHKKKKTRKKRTNNAKHGEGEENETIEEECFGDPRYLDIALKANQSYLKIWGADQPPEVTIGGQIRTAGMTPEESRKTMVVEIKTRMQKIPGGMDLFNAILEQRNLDTDAEPEPNSEPDRVD